MSDWQRAGYIGYQPKSDEEVKDIAEVLEMVQDYMVMTEEERSGYLRGVNSAMEGRRVNFAKAVCSISPDDDRWSPLLEMLERLEELIEPIAKTTMGRLPESFLRENHARRIGNLIQFPVSIEWITKPNPDKGIEGVPGVITYPPAPNSPPPPRQDSFEREERRAPWEFGS
jgi:hypothetical protein